MTYGADSDGSWGQAIKTVEDSGGINRTTSVNQSANGSYTANGYAMQVTNGFTPWGKPADSVDAAGHEFLTYYDPDGKVWSVQQANYGSVVTYGYGLSGNVSYGLPVSVTDNITSVSQLIDYEPLMSGGNPNTAAGLVLDVNENRSGSLDSECAYTYNTAGDRATAKYTDGNYNVLAQWGYYDYLTLGTAGKPARAFQTLCKLDGHGNRTSEEFHYSYDTQGHILECAFAQTPSQTSADSGGWYDTKLAATRCRAHYEYDPAGRLYWIGHYWDTLTNGSYTSQAILGQYCDYEENTGLNRGVKLDSKYETPTSPGSSTFQITQTDSYGYDAQLDYLTGASYGDGLANTTQSWTYDAAGNRNDSVVDNLNRATSIGGVACTNDMFGDRLTMGSNSYGWDQLNRMKTYNSTSYTYRADGMRTYKSNSTGSTSYRYDGQMGMEDIDYAPSGAVSKVTDYGIGSRGIDAIYVTQNGTTSAAYPIYDSHGSMISTLLRQGSGFTTTALRTFDAWGQIRIGVQTGDPKGRFCAKLGHKQDDESGLLYMRARYYEAGSGRFVSEDASHDGPNWYAYCRGNPVTQVDRSGNDVFTDEATALALLEAWTAALEASSSLRAVSFQYLVVMQDFFDFGGLATRNPLTIAVRADLMASLTTVTIGNMGNPTSGGIAQNIIGFFAGYAAMIGVCLFFMDNDISSLN